MKTSQLKMKPALAALCAGLLLAPCPASEHDFDTLFEDSEDTRDVNEGMLAFLPAPPDGVVHAHTTRITLTDDALRDGWAGLYQCHHHIDQVSAAQIVYNTERIRSLAVAGVTGIGRAWVEGASVQLADVGEAASLCITAESQVVRPQADGGFVVRNGPFMRRFLDGYYPMHVTLEILLPPGEWILERSVPVAQPGFSVTRSRNGMVADAWFEGRLETEFYFTPADSL